jgi:hypothetical protein
MRNTLIVLAGLVVLAGACNHDRTSQAAQEVSVADAADVLSCVHTFMLDVHATCMGYTAEPYPRPDNIRGGIVVSGHPDGDGEPAPQGPPPWTPPEDQCTADGALATVVDGRAGALRACLGNVPPSRCAPVTSAPCLPFFDDDRCAALRTAAAAECQLAALASL